MVFANVHAEVAPLLSAVHAVGAGVRRGLAATLHALVAPQGGLPAVALATVAALKLLQGLGARGAAPRAPHSLLLLAQSVSRAAAEHLRLVRQQDVVEVVVVLVLVLRLALGVELLLGDDVVIAQKGALLLELVVVARGVGQ